MGGFLDMHNNALLPHTPERPCAAQRHKKSLLLQDQAQRTLRLPSPQVPSSEFTVFSTAPRVHNQEPPATPAASIAGNNECDVLKSFDVVWKARVFVPLMAQESARMCGQRSRALVEGLRSGGWPWR